MLDAGERQSSVFRAFRDKAILSVLVFSGIRRAELLDLRLRSVDLDQATLRVERGKGRKTRLIPLSGQAVDAVRDWLELRPECNHDYLFSSQACGPLGRIALGGGPAQGAQAGGARRQGHHPPQAPPYVRLPDAPGRLRPLLALEAHGPHAYGHYDHLSPR